jgi:hypothetical protein
MVPSCSLGSATTASLITPPWATLPPTSTRSCPDRIWVSSLLKRWTAGTLHNRISRQHLPYYLDEFTFRFNRRTSRARGLLFYRLLQQAAGTDAHPLAELIGCTGNDWDEPPDN